MLLLSLLLLLLICPDAAASNTPAPVAALISPLLPHCPLAAGAQGCGRDRDRLAGADGRGDEARHAGARPDLSADLTRPDAARLEL